MLHGIAYTVGCSLGCLALLSCASSVRGTRPRAGVRRTGASGPRAIAPTRAILLPTVGRLTLVDEHDDERRYLFGSLRLQLTSHGATIADHRFAAPVAAVTRTDAGWVFVSSDGVVAASESFLGPLRRLGQTAVFSPQGARASRGRAVIVDGTGAVWSTDGVTALAALTPLAREHIESAAFADARHGAAVSADGRLLFTIDAGSHWRSIALGTATAASVSYRDDVLVVETSEGPRRLESNGVLTAAQAPAGGTQRPQAGDATRALYAAVQAFPDLLPGLEAVARDGSADVLIDHDALVSLDRNTGRVIHRATGLSLRGCALSPWGPAIAIHCTAATDDEDPRAYRWNDAEAVALSGPWNALEAVYSDDALHAVRVHACRGDSGGPGALCVLRDGSADWHTVVTGRPIERVVAMHSADALARTDDHRTVLVDTNSGAVTDVRILTERPDLRTVMLTFTRAGGFAGSAADAEGGRYALVGPSVRALHAFPLPVGAVVCGFLDPLRGVAAGRNASRVWRTLDGARHWEALDLGVDGVASEITLLARPEDVYGAVDCEERGCQIGHAAAVLGWGPRAPVSRQVVGPLAPPPALPEARPASPVASAAPQTTPRGRRHGRHGTPDSAGRPRHHGH